MSFTIERHSSSQCYHGLLQHNNSEPLQLDECQLIQYHSKLQTDRVLKARTPLYLSKITKPFNSAVFVYLYRHSVDFCYYFYNVLSLVEKKAISLILRENKLYFTLLFSFHHYPLFLICNQR